MFNKGLRVRTASIELARYYQNETKACCVSFSDLYAFYPKVESAKRKDPSLRNGAVVVPVDFITRSVTIMKAAVC